MIKLKKIGRSRNSIILKSIRKTVIILDDKAIDRSRSKFTCIIRHMILTIFSIRLKVNIPKYEWYI